MVMAEKENAAAKQAATENDDKKRKGVVTVFFRNRGYGFLEDEDGGENFFVHMAEVRGSGLVCGDKVEFGAAAEANPKGNRCARGVTGGSYPRFDEEKVVTGVIETFSETRNFGHVSLAGGERAFLHSSDLVGPTDLSEGDEVAIICQSTARGQRAFHARKTGGAPKQKPGSEQGEEEEKLKSKVGRLEQQLADMAEKLREFEERAAKAKEEHLNQVQKLMARIEKLIENKEAFQELAEHSENFDPGEDPTQRSAQQKRALARMKQKASKARRKQ
jgi:cold shock CspA family protein